MNPSESANRPPEVAVHNRPEPMVGSRQPESAPEKVPGGETHQGGPGGDPAAVTVPTSQLPPIASVNPVQQPTATASSPLVAADDEVMEQEWVQKAKSIVAQTKGDPYNQEKEVGKLQADYIKKRYGKEIKLTSD